MTVATVGPDHVRVHDGLPFERSYYLIGTRHYASGIGTAVIHDSADYSLSFNTSAMKARDCPFCAHGEVDVVSLGDEPAGFAVRCLECGAIGPRSRTADPIHAVHAWNQRQGRLSTVGKEG